MLFRGKHSWSIEWWTCTIRLWQHYVLKRVLIDIPDNSGFVKYNKKLWIILALLKTNRTPQWLQSSPINFESSKKNSVPQAYAAVIWKHFGELQFIFICLIDEALISLITSDPKFSNHFLITYKSNAPNFMLYSHPHPPHKTLLVYLNANVFKRLLKNRQTHLHRVASQKPVQAKWEIFTSGYAPLSPLDLFPPC